MLILAIFGWAAITIGAVVAIVGFTLSELFWVGMGLSSIISGVLYLAMDRGLSLLAEIRNALVGETAIPKRSSFDDVFSDGV